MTGIPNRLKRLPAFLRGKRRLRINFVLPHHTLKPIGGYRVVYEYADFLAKRGHAVSIVYLIDVMKAIVPAWHDFDPSVRLIVEPEIPDGDVTIATFWTTARTVAALPGSKGRKFYLIQHHEVWSGPADQVNATWLYPMRKIVIAKWLLEVGRTLGATDMHYIPNGIDFSTFRITTPPRSVRQRSSACITTWASRALPMRSRCSRAIMSGSRT